MAKSTYDPFDPNKPYDPDEEGSGYLDALNTQLAPEPGPQPTSGVQGEHVGTAEPAPQVTAAQPGTGPSEPSNTSLAGDTRDDALAQVSQTYSNASAATNAANPTANPAMPYVQAGTTGGYLDGTGVTLQAGSSKTQAQMEADIAAALAAGIPQSFIDSFLAENGNTDSGRIQDAYNSQTTGSLPDSNPGGGNPSGPSNNNPGGPSAPGAPAPGAPPSTSTGEPGIREMLMTLLGQLDDPVTADDSILAPQLAAQRLSSQRAFDRDRAAAAERRAFQGLGDSGAMETDIRGLEEGRAERDLGFQTDLIADESQDRRSALMQMLGLGVQDTQFTEAQQQQAAQFAEKLGFDYAALSQDDKHFIDQMAFAYSQLEQSGNLGALNILLGAA